MIKGIKINRVPQYMSTFLEQYARKHKTTVETLLLEAIGLYMESRRDEMEIKPLIDIDEAIESIRLSIYNGFESQDNKHLKDALRKLQKLNESI